MSEPDLIDDVIDGAADIIDAAGDVLGEVAGGSRKRGRLLLLLLIAGAIAYFMKQRQATSDEA